jgi:hypothetical protein
LAAAGIAGDIIRNLRQKIFLFLEALAECLDEALVALAALDLRCGLGGARQRRCDRQPETDEQRQRIGGNPQVALDARTLA